MLNRRTLLRSAAAAPVLAMPHIARAAEKLVISLGGRVGRGHIC